MLNDLIKILKDLNALIEERDDAAIDLGSYDDTLALKTLLEVAFMPEENELVLSSCGESIAQIWIRLGNFNRNDFDGMAREAQIEAEELIKKCKPEWLKPGF